MWKNWLDYFETGLIVILAGFVFLPNAFPPFILVILVTLRLIKAPRSLIPSWQTLLLMIPAIVTSISWAIGGFEFSGWREVELWGLAIAIFLFAQRRDDKKMLVFQNAFVVWSFLQALILLTFLAFTDPFGSFGFSQQVRDAIEHKFHIHPTYITAAWSWALLLFWITSKLKLSHTLTLTSLFLIMIALTGGKMPLIALSICVFIYIAGQREIPLKFRLGLVGSAFLFLLFIGNTPVLQERFEEVTTVNLEYSQGQLLSSTELRIGIWNCSAKSILDNPWFGVGIGNTRQTLEQCFKQYDQIEFFEGEYNTHNQWMHYWLSSGLFGLLILILFYIYLLLWAFKSKRKVLFYFLVFFLLISMTENYFSRQLGVLMWGIFIAECTQKPTLNLSQV